MVQLDTGVDNIGLRVEEVKCGKEASESHLEQGEVERPWVQTHHLGKRHVHWPLHEALMLAQRSLYLK